MSTVAAALGPDRKNDPHWIKNHVEVCNKDRKDAKAVYEVGKVRSDEHI